MPTISYTFVDRCAGGGHTRLDVSFNGAPARRVIYTTEEVRAPLNQLTADEREQIALLVLKVHMAGQTRGEIVTELQSGPVTVTI